MDNSEIFSEDMLPLFDTEEESGEEELVLDFEGENSEKSHTEEQADIAEERDDVDESAENSAADCMVKTEEQIEERGDADTGRGSAYDRGSAEALYGNLNALMRKYPNISGDVLTDIERIANEERHRATIQSDAAGRAALEKKTEKSYADFIKKFPEIRDFEREIPDEVFQRVREGEEIVTAYQGYQNKKLREELEALKAELKNRAAGIGSVSTAGDEVYDEFLEGLMM